MALSKLRVIGNNEQQRIIWMALFAPGVEGRRGLPYVIVGPPGSAKTSILRQLARIGGLPSRTMLGSIRSPVDFLGVPFKVTRKFTDPETFEVREIPYTHYAPPGWVLDLSESGRALAVYDEFNTASIAVQNSMLRVMFEGVVGEHPLPPGVRQLGAMNPISQATGGRELSMALQNRLGVLAWPEVTAQEFTRHHLGGGSLGSSVLKGTGENASMTLETVKAEDEEAAVDARYDAAWAQALGHVTGYLQRRPEALNKVPTTLGTPWPSSRSWEFAMRAYAGCLVYDMTPSEELLAGSAYVGAQVYGEFVRWRKDADLPDPADLLDGKVHFEHTPARLDRTVAVISACTALVSPKNAEKRKERTESLWKFLRDIPDAALDLTMPGVTALAAADLAVGTTAFKMLARLEPIMSAAGMMRGR
jgi:hypothetical protein